jgi:hypothetical protein
MKDGRSVCERELMGLKLFKPLTGLLDRFRTLHPHHNRLLFYDDYIALLLLSYFNPLMSTLRAIQQASDFPSVQKRLGVRRASLGSLSEAARVFDPAPLRGLFAQLVEQALALPGHALPKPGSVPETLRLLAVDGTLWSFLPRMARWFWADGPRPGPPPSFKALVQFDLLKGVPVEASVASGYPSEKRALAQALQACCLYICDRGFCNFELFQAILDAGSSFVCRVTDVLVTRTLETRTLSDAAQKAGVFSDRFVEVGSAPHAGKLRQPLREVRARVFLHPSHNLNAPRQAAGEFIELRLLTDQLDISAEDLILLYRYRWQIEIFFRWLKCTLGCKHFLSHCENGFELQFYAALIAGLLIMLWTGRKPNKRTLEAIQFYLIGWITLAELEAHLAKQKTVRA